MINGQAASRSLQYVQQPVGSVNEALIQNFQKGIVAGMRLAIKVPEQQVEILREQFNAKLTEEREHVGE